MSRTRAVAGLLWLIALMSGAALVAHAQPLSASKMRRMEFPVPHGIFALPEPTRVDLGTSTLYVQSFTTPLGADALIEFYEAALPESGWRLSRAPWQEMHNESIRRLKQALTYYGHRLEEDRRQDAEARLDDMERTQRMLRRQMYATNGAEHVIVNLWGLAGDGGTMVFINRWSGDRRWLGWGRPRQAGLATSAGRAAAPAAVDASARPASPVAPAPAAGFGGLPMTNICCSGEEVPDLRGALPFSIPRFPGAKAVARASTGGISTTVLLMVPADVQQVTAFYREEMPAGGWKPIESPTPSEEPQGATHHMRFQRPDRLCDLTISSSSPQADDAVGGPKTLVTVAIRPRVGGGL